MYGGRLNFAAPHADTASASVDVPAGAALLTGIMLATGCRSIFQLHQIAILVVAHFHGFFFFC